MPRSGKPRTAIRSFVNRAALKSHAHRSRDRPGAGSLYAGLTPESCGLIPDQCGTCRRDVAVPTRNSVFYWRCARSQAGLKLALRVNPWRNFLPFRTLNWMWRCGCFYVLGCVVSVAAAAPVSAQEPAPKHRAPADYTVEPGTKIPLSLINTISTKHSAEGDRVYLETSFPVLVEWPDRHPGGSYVAGTVTQIKKPGRMKGRGELYVRFDSLTLPNGVTRDFRARLGGVDGQAQRRTGQEPKAR